MVFSLISGTNCYPQKHFMIKYHTLEDYLNWRSDSSVSRYYFVCFLKVITHRFPSHITYLPTNLSFVWIAWEWYLSLYLYNENYYHHIIYSIPPFSFNKILTLRRKPLKCMCVCVKEKKLEGEVIVYERRSCCFRLKCYLPLRCIPLTHASVYFSSIFYSCHLSKTLFLS